MDSVMAEMISHVEQAVEEFSVPFEGNPQIFGGSVLTATPLLFESRTHLDEAADQLLDDSGHQAVRLFDAAFGVVDETGLDIRPCSTELFEFRFAEQ